MQKQTAVPSKKRTIAKRALRSGTDSPLPRSKRITKRQMQWVVNRLVDALHPEKIILFGSYAYGEPTLDSDVDLLVIANSSERISVLTGNAYRAVLDKTFPIDILVRTPQWIARRLRLNDFFIQDVVKRGRVLYDNASNARLD